jgi:hypothetical protein
MKALTVRVLGIDATDVDDVFEYKYSIISDGSDIQWVWMPESAAIFDKEYVLENAKRIGIENPETAEDWLEAATSRLNYVLVRDISEPYDSMEEAIKAETEFAQEAKDFQDDESNDEDELMVLGEEEEEDEEK